MKKILTLAFVFSFGIGAYAMDFPVGNLINDVANMQNTSSQLKLLEQQQFSKEEYNEFQDMKQVKEKRNRVYEQQTKDQYREQAKSYQQYNRDLEFVRENGKLILKSVE